MTDVELAPAGRDDFEAILQLNEAAVPHVNSISTATLEKLWAQSCHCKVAKIDGEIIGFLLVLPETADYDSPNFQYFKRRYATFAYVDRIFVSADHHGRGVASRLYGDLVDELGESKPRVTCEVNLDPPNPGSIAFHGRMGFEQVDEQATEGGCKRVSLMVLGLESGP